MNKNKSQYLEKELWAKLADLFFLDTLHEESDFERVAQSLKEMSWTREQTKAVLIELIAPNVATNLGHLIYPPSSGIWTGFDMDELDKKIQKSKFLRKKRHKYFFAISDWWYERMLTKLEMERLLKYL